MYVLGTDNMLIHNTASAKEYGVLYFLSYEFLMKLASSSYLKNSFLFFIS